MIVKDQALLSRLKFLIKPSLVLGLMLFGELTLFAFFAVWVSGGVPVWYFRYQPPVFPPSQWILTVAAAIAMLGWTVSAFVTVKNSVKQHTINTLLQSRLSATYMEKADIVSKHFSNPDGSLIVVTEDDLVNPNCQPKMEALRYVLNYFEFISVGVRHGDLHEGLLKSSLRGMLCKIFFISDVHIKAQRKKAPKVYEHMEWLYGIWKDKDNQ